MSKKIEHLTRELKEFFPEKNSQKIAEHLSHLTEMQEDFSASPYFKSELKTRLRNMYTMEKKSSFSLLSFLRYSGLFASFLFVSGASYIYYTMQQEQFHRGIETRLQEEVLQVPSSQTFETQMTVSESEDDILSVERSVVSQEKSISSDFKTPTRISDTIEKETPKDVSETFSDTSKIVPKTSQELLESSASLKVQESNEEDTSIGSEDVFESEKIEMRKGGSSDEFIITDIINTFETSLPEENTFPSNDMMPA